MPNKCEPLIEGRRNQLCCCRLPCHCVGVVRKGRTRTRSIQQHRMSVLPQRPLTSTWHGSNSRIWDFWLQSLLLCFKDIGSHRQIQTKLCNSAGSHMLLETWADKGLNTLTLSLASRPSCPSTFTISVNITFILVTQPQNLGITIPNIC